MSSAQPITTGPSLFEVTLGAMLSLALGAVLAAGYLAAQPVETVRTLPREPNPDKVYYVTGSAQSSLGKGWLRKKQMLMEPGAATIQLSEDELNTWLNSSKTKSDNDEEGGLIKAKTMNFRLANSQMQVGLPCEIHVAGFRHALIVQARGNFVQTGSGFAYVPNEVMVGQLAAHRLPLVGRIVAGRLESTHDVPTDLAEAWQTLSYVGVQDNKLILQRK